MKLNCKIWELNILSHLSDHYTFFRNNIVICIALTCLIVIEFKCDFLPRPCSTACSLALWGPDLSTANSSLLLPLNQFLIGTGEHLLHQDILLGSCHIGQGGVRLVILTILVEILRCLYIHWVCILLAEEAVSHCVISFHRVEIETITVAEHALDQPWALDIWLDAFKDRLLLLASLMESIFISKDNSCALRGKLRRNRLQAGDVLFEIDLCWATFINDGWWTVLDTGVREFTYLLSCYL